MSHVKRWGSVLSMCVLIRESGWTTCLLVLQAGGHVGWDLWRAAVIKVAGRGCCRRTHNVWAAAGLPPAGGAADARGA